MEYNSRNQDYKAQARMARMIADTQAHSPKREGFVKNLLGGSERKQKFREMKKPVKDQFLKDMRNIRREHSKAKRQFRKQFRREGDSQTEKRVRNLFNMSQSEYERDPEMAERKIIRKYNREESKQLSKRRSQYQRELKSIRKSLDDETHHGMSKKGGTRGKQLVGNRSNSLMRHVFSTRKSSPGRRGQVARGRSGAV